MTTTQHVAAVYEEVLQNRMGLDITVADKSIKLQLVPGLTSVIRLHENDPEYLRLLTYFKGSAVPIDADKLKEICSKATLSTKVAKAAVDEDGDLVLAVETIVAGPDLIPDPDHLQAILPRAISLLNSITQKVLMEVAFAGEPTESR